MNVMCASLAIFERSFSLKKFAQVEVKRDDMKMLVNGLKWSLMTHLVNAAPLRLNVTFEETRRFRGQTAFGGWFAISIGGRMNWEQQGEERKARSVVNGLLRWSGSVRKLPRLRCFPLVVGSLFSLLGFWNRWGTPSPRFYSRYSRYATLRYIIIRAVLLLEPKNVTAPKRDKKMFWTN